MIAKIIIAAVAASVAWFVLGGALYMNPFTAGLYKKFEDSPGLKKWDNTTSYLIYMYLLVLIQCLLFAAVYAFLKPIFAKGILINGLLFGLLLIAIKILPRFFDMWIQTSYPNVLLGIEIINGVIGSFVMALLIAAFI